MSETSDMSKFIDPRKAEYIAKKLKKESKRRDNIIDARWERHFIAYLEKSKSNNL